MPTFLRFKYICMDTFKYWITKFFEMRKIFSNKNQHFRAYSHISFELMYQLIIENLMYRNIMYRFYQNIEKASLFYLIQNQILLNDLIHQLWNLTTRNCIDEKEILSTLPVPFRVLWYSSYLKRDLFIMLI
jgi:hypothetical protein